jgi:hypothetical protein
MDRLWKFIEALGETDAQPLVKTIAVVMTVAGLLMITRLLIAAQPYRYRVQCRVPAAGASHVTLTNRRSGLVTEGPSPDASGAAKLESDGPYEDYEVVFEGSPCRLAGDK